MVTRTQSARQARRVERARAQADRYEVRPAVIAGADAGFAWWVVNKQDRRIYSVHNGVCDCEDFKQRCTGRDGRPNGLRCKHVILVEERGIQINAAHEDLDAEAAADPVCACSCACEARTHTVGTLCTSCARGAHEEAPAIVIEHLTAREAWEQDAEEREDDPELEAREAVERERIRREIEILWP